MKRDRILQELKGTWAIAKKDIRIYYFKPPVLIFGIVSPFFLFLAFAIGRGMSPISLLPGIVGITLFFTASSVGPIIVPWETRAKTLERLLSSPVSIQSILSGDIIAGSLFGILLSLVPLLVGIFGLGANVVSVYTLILSVLLSAYCFSSLGVLLSAPPTDNPSNVMMLSILVRLPVVFISGIFIPLEQLPSGGRIVGLFSPLTYTTDLLRYSLQGFGYYPIGLDLSMIALFIVLFLFFGMRFHKKNLSKRI